MNKEVEELFEDIRLICLQKEDTPFIYDNYLPFVEEPKYKNMLNQLKTKFAQMERENKQYKQLLDKIGLHSNCRIGYFDGYYYYTYTVSHNLYNILKQLKSIGSDKNE